LLWDQGHDLVIGIDEVGRGCLAGPLTVAAVGLPKQHRIRGIRDSKWLTPKEREQAARQIRMSAAVIGIGWASHSEIDELGLTSALGLAGRRALLRLPRKSAIILDGKHNYLYDAYAVTTQVKADQTCKAVAAASVIAKVARDHYMELVHHLHPQYGFNTNRGYGSARHLSELAASGPSPFHRRSFNPLREALIVG
ncbi:MAG TPA: ribonuclease HII, partial [Candidatus Saccharimonadia bacterium]